jgi:hypothetical protein
MTVIGERQHDLITYLRAEPAQALATRFPNPENQTQIPLPVTSSAQRGGFLGRAPTRCALALCRFPASKPAPEDQF